ncbi:MAG: hypothetical protein ACRDL7_10040, partial [Gaiellaceae bacterium]
LERKAVCTDDKVEQGKCRFLPGKCNRKSYNGMTDDASLNAVCVCSCCLCSSLIQAGSKEFRSMTFKIKK